jgi:hypothetical protein
LGGFCEGTLTDSSFNVCTGTVIDAVGGICTGIFIAIFGDSTGLLHAKLKESILAFS